MPGFIDEQEGRVLFGADPRNYNDIRPPYPEQIYEFLVTTGALHSNTSTLEIGAGNGLATRRLLDFGANPLTVVEPDKRFFPLLTSIEKLYKADLRFIEASFEDAELPRSHYDLVAAATSFHWIQPSVGLAKVAEVLKPGGYVALWWRVFGDLDRDDPYHEATRTILQPLSSSPSGVPDTVPFALDTPARLRDFSSTGQAEAFGVTEWICIRSFRLKAGLRTDFPRSLQVALRRPETMKRRREGRANWQFALTPSMRPFGKTRQTASLPYLFRGVQPVAWRR